MSGLDIGSTYYFSVRGFKRSGDAMLYGKWSETRKFKIYDIGQPEITSVSNKGKKVSVKWKEVPGSKIRYRICVDTKNSFWYDDTTKKTSLVLNCKGLKKGMKFKVFVYAYVCQKGNTPIYDDSVMYCSKTVTSKVK